MSSLNSAIERWPWPAALGLGQTRRWLHTAGPPLVVLTGALALWLTTGVRLSEAALFIAYHAVSVMAPGWIVYRLLRPADAMRVRQLAVGWALGYVLEVLVFAGSAALGDRGALRYYPLLVFGAGAALWRRRVRSAEPTASVRMPLAWSWCVAAICLVGFGLVGVEYFGSAPLPSQVARVSYGIDTVWYLSLAAEALHHWPVSDPTVAGQPLYYHLFSSFDPAAIAQTTRLALPVVFLRLYVLPMVALVVLGLSVAGASLGRRWAGPVAAVLVLAVGELNVDPHVGYKFANELGDDIVSISPSFLMGAAMFAPMLALLCELAGRTSARPGPRGLPWGALAAFTLLAVGAAGAKAPIPTVLAGGLLAYLIWHSVVRRAIDLPVTFAFAVTVVVFAGFWLLSYGGAGSDQMSLRPPGVVRQMDVTAYFAALAHPRGLFSPILWIGLSVVGVVGAYGAQLVGLLGGPPRSRAAPLLLAIFAFGQAPYLLYTHPGLSQVFFSEYGVIAASLLAAEGLLLILACAGRRCTASLAAGCALATVAAAFALPPLLGLHGDAARNVFLYVDLILACALVACVLLRRRLGRRWVYAAVAVLAVGLTGRVLTVVAPTASQLAADRPLYSQTGPGLTAGLYRALAWVRARTSPSSVLAVNNFRDWSLYWSDGWAVPDDFNYSAFAERPVFLEGWIYTQAAADAPDAAYYGRPLLFPGRVALNNAIFQWAHAAALRTAAEDYGVRYLLVDRVHNRANPRLATIARLVYSNHDAAVYAVPRADLLFARAAPPRSRGPRHV